MWRNFLFWPVAQRVTALLLAIALAALWFLAIRDEREILGDSAARLDGESLTIRKMEQQLGQTQALVETYRQNNKEIGFFRGTYLSRRDERIVGISDFLEQRARARGVRMEEVRYQTAQTKDRDLEIYSIDLPLVGRYRDIRALIGDIEQSSMFLVITELSLEDDSGSEGAVRMNLSLATYFEGSGS